MRWVWDMERGEDAPEFKDLSQAQRILGFLVRHMNDIAQTLTREPEQYEPLLMENPNGGDPIPILDEWCSGFMKGVQLDSEGWLPVIAGKPDWMSTILLYGTEEGWDALKKKIYLWTNTRYWRRGWPGRFGEFMPYGLNNAVSRSRKAIFPTLCAGNQSVIRRRWVATIRAPAGLAKSSNSVMGVQADCTERQTKAL